MPLHDVPSAADFLVEAARLGPVRAVLRNCGGFVEVFCSCEDFRVTPQWLNLHSGIVHLHVEIAGLQAAHLREAGACAHPERPSIWFYGRCGRPSLLLIFDRTEGPSRAYQEAAFETLRQRYGERVQFGDGASPARTLH